MGKGFEFGDFGGDLFGATIFDGNMGHLCDAFWMF